MDNEGNTIDVIYSCNVACPSYVIIFTTSLSIEPLGTEATVGFTLTISLSDGNMSTDYSLTINIAANQPPVLSSDLIPATVAAGSIVDYGMPGSSDPEGDPISCSLIIPKPTWVTITDCTTIGIAAPFSASG